MTMTEQKYMELHKSLDELVSDFIGSYKTSGYKSLAETSLLEFLTWSAEQTKNPDLIKT